MSLVRTLATSDSAFEVELRELLARDSAQDAAIDEAVAAILANVRARGDAALTYRVRAVW